MDRRSAGWAFAFSIVLALSGSAGAEDGPLPSWLHGTLSVTTGVDVSTGSYGEDEDTDILFVPTSVAYLLDGLELTPFDDQLELRATVPYLRVDGPGFLVDGSVVVPDQDSRTDDGLGDVVLSATYILYPSPGASLPVLELASRVKLPTADERRGLGTGETDVTLEVGVSKRLGDLSPFASLGYRFMGDPPDARLDDVLLTSVGATYSFTPRWSAGLVYDWRQAAAPTADDAHELVPFLWVSVGRGVRIGSYTVFGLSDGSPDYGGGLQLKFSTPVR